MLAQGQDFVKAVLGLRPAHRRHQLPEGVEVLRRGHRELDIGHAATPAFLSHALAHQK